MVSHGSIGLPESLALQFDKWIDWFGDYMPGTPEADTFDWEAFDQEGQRLAKELAAVVGDRFSVEYSEKEIHPDSSNE